MSVVATRVPHDEAEKHVLGSLLLSRRAFDDVTGLEAGDFYAPRHELIYTTAQAMHGRGEGVDAVTVAAALTRAGDLARAGGAPYLHELIHGVPTASNVAFYAQIVRDQAVLRRLHAAGTRIAQAALAGEGDVDGLVEVARTEIDSVSRAVVTRPGLVGDTIDTTIEALDAPFRGTPTPWSDLSCYIGGWVPGRVYIVGARPSVGKTLLALNAARRLARDVAVSLHSLEMSTPEMHLRLIADLAKVDLGDLEQRNLALADWEAISRAQDELRSLRLYISDNPSTTVHDVASHARAVARLNDGRVGAVVVDYVQLMEHPAGRSGRDESRQQELASTSRRLKLLARELDCPVIVLSQLNRSSEHRANRLPTLADLRESGALEQDSDVVLLLHEEDDQPGVVQVAVAKNRHGKKGSLELVKQGQYARFANAQWTPTNVIEGGRHG